MPGAAAAVRLRRRINSDRGMAFFPVEVGVPYGGDAKLLLLRAVAGGGMLSGRPVRCAFPCFCLLSFGSGGRVAFFVGAPISGGGMRFDFSSFAKGGNRFSLQWDGLPVVSDDCGCIFRPSASWLAVADDLVYKGIEDGRYSST